MDQPSVVCPEVSQVRYLRGDVQGHSLDLLPVLHCLHVVHHSVCPRLLRTATESGSLSLHYYSVLQLDVKRMVWPAR